jgi:hypothetical protein
MFTKETVLILGAGASTDLGYPIGKKLVSDIIQSLKPPKVNYSEEILSKKFLTSLEDFQPLSIDFFLSLHKEYADLGKEKIAQRILNHQRSSLTSRNFDESWYRYLLTEILRGCEDGKQKNLTNNKLTIITFNYDVSLEYFLYSRLKHMKYFENHKKEMNDFLESNLEIIHVYGSVIAKEFMIKSPRTSYESPVISEMRQKI